ncbi:MAG TPA: hypothetical protein DCL43_03425, partial [Chitinophagaceae bacterium]|nr:hypothetical protein [Chitinophagaceae bacterium]
GNTRFSDSTSANTRVSYDTSGTYVLTWRYRNDAGCADTRDTVVLVVVRAAEVVQQVTANDTVVCAGANITVQFPSNNSY